MSSTTLPRKKFPGLPVLSREMRSTMRGRRLIIRLAVAGILPAVLAITILLLMRAPLEFIANETGARMMEYMPMMGRAVFLALVAAEYLLILFVAPGLTASTFAAEQEAQTLESLFLTPLSTANIVMGKLLCAVSTLALLLLCGFPVVGVAALYGGISLADLWWTQGILLCTLLFTACLGLYCSTLFRRTNFAILTAYSSTLLLLLGPVIGLFILAIIGGSPDTDDPVAITVLLVMAVVLAAGIATPVMHGLTHWLRGRRLKTRRRREQRQRSLRSVLLGIWGLVFLLCVAPLVVGVIIVLDDFSSNFPYLLTGNPACALGLYGVSMYESLDSGGMPIFFQHYFIPTTAGVLLLGALLLFWATVQRVNVLRRPE